MTSSSKGAKGFLTFDAPQRELTDALGYAPLFKPKPGERGPEVIAVDFSGPWSAVRKIPDDRNSTV
jgi:hypothetical protein